MDGFLWRGWESFFDFLKEVFDRKGCCQVHNVIEDINEVAILVAIDKMNKETSWKHPWMS